MPPGRARMAAISERLATLHTDFGQNVLRDETEWQMELGEDDLGGLPDFARAAAAQAAAERGVAGWAITLSRSSVEPFLVFSTRRDLRERAWRAWVARGDASNPALIGEILALRQERARLLGFADFRQLPARRIHGRQPRSRRGAAAPGLGPRPRPGRGRAGGTRSPRRPRHRTLGLAALCRAGAARHPCRG